MKVLLGRMEGKKRRLQMKSFYSNLYDKSQLSTFFLDSLCVELIVSFYWVSILFHKAGFYKFYFF